MTYAPKEFRITALRDCPMPRQNGYACDTPDKAAGYWNEHVQTGDHYNPDVEQFVVLLLTARRRVKGHVLIAIGTLDSVNIHPREVFRPLIIGAAASTILMHNHPGGDPSPSDADVKWTRELILAGRLLKIDVLDHVIIGSEETPFVSLRTLGYFHTS